MAARLAAPPSLILACDGVCIRSEGRTSVVGEDPRDNTFHETEQNGGGKAPEGSVRQPEKCI